MKKIPIGIDDFKKIRENNIYYVDKTKYIEKILVDTSEVKLFTRPRRFGKTLNMSMLKYFFDIKNKEENKKLFKNLYIENSDFFWRTRSLFCCVYFFKKNKSWYLGKFIFFNGISMEENISGNSDLSVLMREDEIWELLLFSGYLTIDEKIGESYEDIYTLRLPNREVKEFFRKKFIDINFGESTLSNKEWGRFGKRIKRSNRANHF